MSHRVKRSPTLHQKRVRFLTGLAFVIMFLVAGLLFWLMNRAEYAAH
jgi:hypothetical protein